MDKKRKTERERETNDRERERENTPCHLRDPVALAGLDWWAAGNASFGYTSKLANDVTETLVAGRPPLARDLCQR